MNLTFTKRAAKHGDSCQLCRPAEITGRVLPGYATVCGVRLCRSHLSRLANIIRYAKHRRSSRSSLRETETK